MLMVQDLQQYGQVGQDMLYKERVDRFAKFAVNVMGVEPQENDDATALKGIEAMEAFYHSINMPTSIKELGIDVTEEQIQEMAEKCIVACGGFAGKVKNYIQKM